MELLPYNSQWKKTFLDERKRLEGVLGRDCLDVQHIGSTAIPGILSKPVIDIAVLIPSLSNAHQYVVLLEGLGYTYFPERSSVERLFLTKGNPPQFHLSLAQQEKFSFWKRQILFRDYLLAHPNQAKEYEILKEKLLDKHSDAGQLYSDGKSDFVNNILSLAEKNK